MMSMPLSGSVSGLKNRRRYSFLSLFTKWTLPVHGATSTLPEGWGSCLWIFMVADRGRAFSLAFAAPVIATVILLFLRITAFRGAGNLGQRGARSDWAALSGLPECTRFSDYSEQIESHACGLRGRRRFPQCLRESTGPWEPGGAPRSHRPTLFREAGLRRNRC